MKRWQQRMLWIAGVTAAVYGMVYADVVLRARDACRQGDQYWRWADHPDEKAQMLDAKLARDKAALEAERAKQTMDPDQYARRLEILQFDHDQALKESSIKYAYIWYQTTVDLFSPPDSKWVRIAREKMPLAKERWKAELRAKKIPFEDYMID